MSMSPNTQPPSNEPLWQSDAFQVFANSDGSHDHVAPVLINLPLSSGRGEC
jgi:hypothetical protein